MTYLKDLKLTDNFWLHEFFDSAEWVRFMKLPEEQRLFLIISLGQVAAALQEHVRDYFRKKTIITDGMRFKASGDGTSFHHSGKAADFKVEGVHHRTVQDRLNLIYPGGIGSYNAHTHLDIRHLFGWPVRARWTGKSQ